MSTFTVLACITIAEGHDAEVARGLAALAAPTRAEPGCLHYAIYRDLHEPSNVLIHEIWRRQADWIEHLEQPHLITFKEDVLPGRATLSATKLKPAA